MEHWFFRHTTKIQNLAFPEGVKWDREKDIPRTDVENEVLRTIRLLSSTYRNAKNEKTGKSFDFPALVDYRTELSNFYASYTCLVRFAKYLVRRGITLPV